MSTKRKTKGMLVPLVTPFYKGRFDDLSMTKLIKSINNNVDGFISCLSSGEGGKLSDNQWETVVRTVSKSTSKPVFAGILRGSEKGIEKLVKKANKISCDGVVIPTIYSSEKRNHKFLLKMINISEKPIIIYNTEKNSIKSLAIFKDLAGKDKIIGVKDSSLDVNFFKTLLKYKSANDLNLEIFQGMENLLLASKGCDGYIISLLNTKARMCRRMFKNPTRINNKAILNEYWKQNLGGQWFISLKAILYSKGIIRSSEEVNLKI